MQLKSLPSECLRSTVNKRELMYSSYIAPEQTTDDIHVYNGPIVPLYGAHHHFNWKAGSGTVYRVLDRASFAPPEFAYGNVETEEPGCAYGPFGKGKGIVISFTIGRG